MTRKNLTFKSFLRVQQQFYQSEVAFRGLRVFASILASAAFSRKRPELGD